MTPTQTVILVSILVVFDFIVVTTVIQAIVSGSFGALAKKCPPDVPLAPGAPYREFQDMKFGMSNFGKCIHIGIDDSGMHLHPAMILRWAGARPVTVPWTMIEVADSSRTKGLIPCKLAGIKARVPAWCFDDLPQLGADAAAKDLPTGASTHPALHADDRH